MKLVGFSGSMGVGKSTAIQLLKELTHDGVLNVKFAQPLYDIQEYIYRRVSSVHTPPQGFVKDRKLLQWLGTNWGRETVGEHIWTDLWRAQVSQVHKDYPRALIVCDDVRFNNEAQLVRSLGGVVVRMESNTSSRNISGNGISKHASENGVDNSVIDAIIENNGTVEDLKLSLLTLNDTLGIW